jgi:hypothetical protein
LLCCYRESRDEIESLTNLIQSIWSAGNVPTAPNTLDLDAMFSFLQDDRSNGIVVERSEKQQALEAITDELSALDDLIAVSVATIIDNNPDFV